MSKHDLKDLKERCNEQSWEQGLHVPEKGKTFAGEVREETVAWSKDTYQLLKQAEQGKVKSYVQDIALAVLDCKETATSRETFIRLMNERGYGVDWQDSHKYITYTDLAREQAGEKACKIRDNKLEKYYNMDFGKESMEHEFERNARTAEAEQSKRAASRVKPTESDRAGKQSAQRSVGDVERELRGIDTEPFEQVEGNITIEGVDFDCTCVMLQSKWGNYGKFNGEKLELERFIKRYKNYSFEIVDELYGYNQVLYSGYLSILETEDLVQMDISIYFTGKIIYDTKE
ncbi:relaxase/mobilization nuclease domain-containing protein [Campylobacter jejuni]|nr:relaxase/mobilization nuclease domain-containing protein [Campylobacter jejuni]EGP9800776.1 relaxase/mobilization nuclease domain-containing protein [Campylobacter jejuni]